MTAETKSCARCSLEKPIADFLTKAVGGGHA